MATKLPARVARYRDSGGTLAYATYRVRASVTVDVLTSASHYTTTGFIGFRVGLRSGLSVNGIWSEGRARYDMPEWLRPDTRNLIADLLAEHCVPLTTRVTRRDTLGTLRQVAAVCPDGKVRRTVYLGNADTYFSLPARMRIAGRSVRGYVTARTVERKPGESVELYVFVPYGSPDAQ